MILIIDENAEKLAQQLDDYHLDKMIKSLAQTLCNVHYLLGADGKCNCGGSYPPLSCPVNYDDKLSQWARTCRANYLKLVEIALACCLEWRYRFSYDWEGAKKYEHKLLDVIIWARDNVPQFSNYRNDGVEWPPEAAPGTPFPLVIPEKYISKGWEFCEYNDVLHESYRAYYRSLLKKREDKHVKCKNCEGLGKYLLRDHVDGDPWPVKCDWCNGKGIIFKGVISVFTRRPIPNFLADLAG